MGREEPGERAGKWILRPVEEGKGGLVWSGRQETPRVRHRLDPNKEGRGPKVKLSKSCPGTKSGFCQGRVYTPDEERSGPM